MSNNETCLWVEQCMGRKLTSEEKERIDFDITCAKDINTGSVEALKSIGIEI